MMYRTSSGLADQAIALHRRGFVPLPLRKGGKHLDLAAMGYLPLHHQTRRKSLRELAFTSLCYHFSQKPPMEADIASWFSGFCGNIGILGGYNGLMVLDFDNQQHFAQWQKDHADLLSRTPAARTPHGYHVYVRTSAPTVTSSMYSGFRRVGHIKSLGGYVVACPSVIGGDKNYRWLNDRSPFDVSPCAIDTLASLRLRASSPLKSGYDRVRRRGYFEPQ